MPAMSFVVFVSMTPLDKGESVGRYVAEVVDVVDRSGLAYVLTPMGTIVEGADWDEVMDVLREGFGRLRAVSSRVSITMKIDAREGPPGRLTSKVRSVERALGRTLRTTEGRPSPAD